MFDRFKHTQERESADRTIVEERPRGDGNGHATRADPTRPTAARSATTAATMRAVLARQREEYGGLNWGAAFFGWLVAVGVAVLLTGVLAAAGAAIGLTESSTAAEAQAQPPETLTLAGAVALLVVLAIAYYSGGYVAGRMSRFDGARQGLGTWFVGLLITLAIAIVAVVLGTEYNVVERANLPRLPVGDETLTLGGAVATIGILVGTLLFAALGGVAGARYHRKIDRAGDVD